MNTISKQPTSSSETTVTLGSLSPSDCFRYAYISYDTAISTGAFNMVCSMPSNKRITIVSLADGTVLARDPEHQVIQHQLTMTAAENK